MVRLHSFNHVVSSALHRNPEHVTEVFVVLFLLITLACVPYHGASSRDALLLTPRLISLALLYSLRRLFCFLCLFQLLPAHTDLFVTCDQLSIRGKFFLTATLFSIHFPLQNLVLLRH